MQEPENLQYLLLALGVLAFWIVATQERNFLKTKEARRCPCIGDTATIEALFFTVEQDCAEKNLVL